MNEPLYPRVQAQLGRLKLPRMAECLDSLAEQAAKHEWTYLDFLDHLLEAEVSARSERDIAMKTKLAHFPFLKTLDQFDFAFNPPSVSGRSKSWRPCASWPTARTSCYWVRRVWAKPIWRLPWEWQRSSRR